MGFQNKVNIELPVGVEGDFSSVNPYFSTLTPTNGSFRVGDESGINVGTYAWADMTTGLVTKTQGSLKLGGFVGRYNQAVVTYGEEASLNIPQGRGISLYKSGSFWARFSAGATAGQIVAADITTGILVATNAVSADLVDTGYIVATNANANELAKIQGK